MIGRHIDEARDRRKRCWLLVFAAKGGRTDTFRVHILAVLLGGVLRHHHWPPVSLGVLVHIDLGSPVDLGIELFRYQQLASDAIERIAETIAIKMNQELARGATDGLIDEDHFVYAVEVPLIVGGHLIDPFRHAGVWIARPDGHRPLVVARPLLWIPGRRITGAVIDEVQLGIVGNPSPGASSSDFPLIAFPRLQAGVGPDRLAELRSFLRIDQQLLVWPFGVAAPDLLAGLEIIRSHVALHPELAARDANQNLILHYHGG